MENTTALGALRRRWWIVLLLAMVGGILGALPGESSVEEQATTYTATHTMLVNNTDALSFGNTAIAPGQVTLLATTGEVPKRVAEQLGYGGNPAELASQVEATFDVSTGALKFTTTQSTPQAAEDIANAFADVTNSYLAERQDEIYQDRLAASRDRLAELETKLDDLRVKLNASPDDPVIQAQLDAVSRQYGVAFEADQTLSESPDVLAFTTLEEGQAIPNVDRGISAPQSRTTRAALGFLVGAALGAGVAIFLGRVDRRLRTREQAEAVLDMRARVLVPKVRDQDRDHVVVVNGRHDPLSDSYRTLRNVVTFVQGGLEPVNRARVTLVVSPGPGDGKTSLAANLAAAFVETGVRTVAVNTDFRRPRLSSAINDGPTMQLPFILEDLATIDPKLLLGRTVHNNLLVMDLSTMDASAGELVRATARMVPEIAEIAEAVVVDSSPVGVTAEVLEMVPVADVIVVVVKVGHTPIEAARRTVATLRDLTGAPMILALTGTKIEKTAYYEYTDRKAPNGKPDDRGGRGRRLEQVG